jgi:outer membrane protein assembly factor BamB
MLRVNISVGASAVLMLILTSGLNGADWPCYRGTNKDGISTEQIVQWPPREIWRAAIGEGFSQVVVSGGRVYTMGWSGNNDHVYCFSESSSGVNPAPLWTSSYACGYGGDANYAGTRSTPTVDSNEVYTFSCDGDLNCFDKMTGAVKWSRTVNVGMPGWGFGSSPLIEGSNVIVNAGSHGIAIDKSGARTNWSSSGSAGYASPFAFTRVSQRTVVLFGGNDCTGVDPSTGAVLWRLPWAQGMADPIIFNDKVWVSCGYGKGNAIAALGTGLLTPGIAPNTMYSKENCSVLYNGFVYGPSEGGFCCVEFNTGTLVWNADTFGTESAVMMANDQLVIMNGANGGGNGDLVIVQAVTNGYTEVFRSNSIFSAGYTWTAPTLANGRLYIRNNDVSSGKSTLICYDVRGDIAVDKPDLSVVSITLNPPQPSTGATFTASVVIRNSGLASATNVHVSLWLDKPDVAVDNTGETLGADIGVIAVNQAVTNVFLGLDGGAVVTQKTMRVFVDSTLQVAEENEANNQLTLSYRPVAHADFAISDITLDPAQPLYGKTFTAYVTVTNQGGIAGNAGYLYVWTNQPAAVLAKARGYTKSVSTGTLAAGAGKRYVITGLKAGDAGPKVFRAFADATAMTTEMNESNNQTTLDYTVVTKPDLIVASIVLTPSVPARGGDFDATVVTKNIGSAPATNVYVSVWENLAVAPTNDSGEAQGAMIGTIQTNRSFAYTFTGLCTGTGTVTRTFRAFANSDHGIDEISESNNQMTLKYKPASRPDFAITSISFSPVDPVAGSNFTAYVTITNSGYASGSAGYVDVWADNPTNVVAGRTVRGDKYQLAGILKTNAANLLIFTGLSAGTDTVVRTFRALVDSRAATSEVCETNNEATVTYTPVIP